MGIYLILYISIGCITVKNDGNIYLEESVTHNFDQKLDMTLVIDMLGD